MNRKSLALVLLIVSVVFFTISFNSNPTGNIIGSFPGDLNIHTIFGFVFLIASLIMFISKKSLEVIIIPTGPKELYRAEKAVDYGTKHRGENAEYLISGNTKAQRRSIYDYLRERDIEPEKIMISRGEDTEEGLEYAFKTLLKLNKLDDLKEIWISSTPSHLDRFQRYFNKLQKQGKINKNLKLRRIETEDSGTSKVYEFFARAEEIIPFGNQLKKLIGEPIKNFINSFYKK